MTITPVTEVLPDITREEACHLVVSGMESIRTGILAYHQLGLTDKDLFNDLEKAGYQKSYRTLRKYTTDLRREGLLPKAENNAHLKKSSRSNGSQPAGKKLPAIVENPEPETAKKDDEVNDVQQQAADEIIKSKDDYIYQLHAVIDDLAAKLESAKNSTLSNHDEPQRIRQQQQLDDPSRLALVEVSTESGMDSKSLPPIDYDWHRGIQVGSKECDDYCRVGRLIDEAASIVHEYFLEGKWGPREWESLAGAFGGPYQTCLAQRRFRPRSEQGPIVDIR